MEINFQFSQNSGCRKYLLKTLNNRLAYCHEYDLLLGTGVSRFDTNLKYLQSCPGANWVGEMMMLIRGYFLHNPLFSDEVESVKREVNGEPPAKKKKREETENVELEEFKRKIAKK